MIRINLLPLEKRKPERTPLPRFVLIMAGAALATGIVLYLVTVYLDINSTQAEIDQTLTELATLKPDEAEYARVEAEKTAREKMIKDLEQMEMERSVPWADIVDSLWDVVHQNPRIWLEDFKTLDQRSADTEIKKANPRGGMTALFGIAFKCGAAGSDVTTMAKFRKDLQTHPVLSQYFNAINTLPELSPKSEQNSGKISLSFNVTLYKIVVQAQQPQAQKPVPPPAK